MNLLQLLVFQNADENLKNYIYTGRKVYLELQDIKKYLDSADTIDPEQELVKKTFKKYFNQLYSNITSDPEYMILS
jgi:chaperonin cofactor prefoldin